MSTCRHTPSFSFCWTTQADQASRPEPLTGMADKSFHSYPSSSPLLSSVDRLSSAQFPFQNQSHSCAVFFSCSCTQPELWVHSPLIHCRSYLSTGTIATERAQLRTKACRKIAPLPQGCGTLSIQQRQPGSLSVLGIKSFSVRVRKRNPASVCLTVGQMEFLLLQFNRRQQEMTDHILTWCRLVRMLIYYSSLCLFAAKLHKLASRAVL